MVRIKNEAEIGLYEYSNLSFSEAVKNGELSSALTFDDVKWLTTTKPDISSGKTPNQSSHFSHLFSSYSKYYNKKYNRHGSLFEKPFRRKEIQHEKYFQNLVIYIHNNPVKHGYVEHPIEYGWSSYLSCVSDKISFINKNETLNWFNDLENFKFVHEKDTDVSSIEKMLGVV